MSIKFTFEQVRQIERETHPMFNGALFPDRLNDYEESSCICVGFCEHENIRYNVYAVQWGSISNYDPDLIVTRVDSDDNEFMMAENEVEE